MSKGSNYEHLRIIIIRKTEMKMKTVTYHLPPIRMYSKMLVKIRKGFLHAGENAYCRTTLEKQTGGSSKT